MSIAAEIGGREPQARAAPRAMVDPAANTMRTAEKPGGLFDAALAQTLPYQRR